MWKTICLRDSFRSNFQFLYYKSHVKSAKDEIIFSLKEFIIIIPGAISNFSWGNETIKHCKVEKKRKTKCSLCHYDLYSIYYLNTGFQCRLSSLSSVIRNTKLIVALWPWHWSVCSFWYHNFNNYSWTRTSTLLLYHSVHHLLHILNSLGLESTAHDYNHSVSHSVSLPLPLPLWRCGKTPTFSLLTHFSS